VLPPFNGGLHCGTDQYAQIAGLMQPVLPPFNGGLHCGSLTVTNPSGAFGVLPPFNGGLHCGGET